MKKIMLITVTILVSIIFLYSEWRNFYKSPKGEYVTVWKTYNNICYVIPYKYHGMLPPSDNYIKTNNSSLGTDLIWENNSDTLLVQADEGSQIVNKIPNRTVIVDYNLNKRFNDSSYTYLDTTLHIRRYKKGINKISISINNMGAL